MQPGFTTPGRTGGRMTDPHLTAALFLGRGGAARVGQDRI